MNRPYIICHMMQSLDGRVACYMVDKISGDEYYTALDALDCQAHIEGKHSYQIHYCGFDEFKPTRPERIDKETYFNNGKEGTISISVDTRGTLLWDGLDNSNHLCIISEQTSTEYLDYLRDKGISYIVCGKKHIDLDRAMEILHDQFGVKRVAVVGGGAINGGFLKAGLLDEVSAMIAPGIDGRIGQPALFDGVDDKDDYLPTQLKFKEITTFPNGVIWARYSL